MGRTYRKLENGSYAVTTESGDYEVKRSYVGVNIVFSDVRRHSSRGNDAHEPEKGFITKRHMQGSWTPENYYFELISEEGEKPPSIPVSVYVGIGDPADSRFSHWNASGEIEEQFNVSIYVPEETFDWFWNESASRPTAKIGARIHLLTLMAGIEASMWYEVPHNTIRLEPEELVAIRDVNLWVSDPKVKNPDPEVEQGTTFFERLEHSFDSASIETWLKRIFVALVAIGVVLLFRR